MNVKVIPVHIEIDAKNPEQPLKVQYIIELTTEVYSDVIGGGMTYVADEVVSKAIDAFIETIQTKISQDLGIVPPSNDITTTHTEEEEL